MCKEIDCLDLETTSLEVMAPDARITVVGLKKDSSLLAEQVSDFNLLQVRKVLEDPNRFVFIHNAKFDLSFLLKCMPDMQINATILDTEVLARLEYNDHLKYSLDECAKRIGLSKSDAVDLYIKKNGLWEWIKFPGKKNRKKNKFYGLVPMEILLPYAEKDVEVCHSIGMHSLSHLREEDGSLLPIVKIEAETTKSLLEVERKGVLCDRAYCEEASKYESKCIEDIEAHFLANTGKKFLDSAKYLGPILKERGVDIGKTEKGQDSVDKSVLEKSVDTVGKLILEHRDHTKRLGTYFTNFTYLSRFDSRIHPNYKQTGARTLRMSCTDPNMQNLSSEEDPTEELIDESFYPIRRAFIPDPGYIWVSMDFKAQEYRLLADLAQEKALIRKILAGEDVHEATAQLLGISRKQAKTLNFALLYGVGKVKLADNLKCSVLEAVNLKRKYFDALPKIENLIKQVTYKAKTKKFIQNRWGAIYRFPNPDFAYKAPNALIQGGCAIITKVALNNVSSYLKDKKSFVTTIVHDEINYCIHRSELDIIPELKKLMEAAYNPISLPMEVSIEWSDRSWHDLKEWGVFQDGSKL